MDNKIFTAACPAFTFAGVTTTGATTEFEFLKELEQNENTLPRGIVQELKDFKNDYSEHNGLLPNHTCPSLLGVSQQRWHQLREKYGFWNATYFGKTWYSRRQLEDFYKVRRKNGKPAHDVAKALKSILPVGE